MREQVSNFKLFYPIGSECPYQLMDQIHSGVTDGRGMTHMFIGYAFVIDRTDEYGPYKDEHKVVLTCKQTYMLPPSELDQ